MYNKVKLLSIFIQIASVTTPLPATPEVNEDTSSARTALSDSEDNSIPQAEVTKVMSTEQLNKGNVLSHHVTVNIDVSKAFDDEYVYLMKRKDYQLADTLPVEKKDTEQEKVSAKFESSDTNVSDVKSGGLPQGSSLKPSPDKMNQNKNDRKFTKLKYSVGFDLSNISVSSPEENESWGGGESPPHTLYRRLSQIRPPVDVAASIVAARKKSLLEKSASSEVQDSRTQSNKGHKCSQDRTQSGLILNGKGKVPSESIGNSLKKEINIVDRSSLSPGQCIDLKIPPTLENYRHNCNKNVGINRYTYGTEVYTSPQRKPSQLELMRKKSHGNLVPTITPIKKTYTDDLSNLYNQTHNIPKASLKRNSKLGEKETFVFYRPRIFPRGSPSESKVKIPLVPSPIQFGHKFSTPTSPPSLQKPVYQPTPYRLFRKNSSRVSYNLNGRHALDLAVNK